MNSMIRRGLIFLLAAGILLTISSPIYAQQITSRYFIETGHTVQGEFLTYYLAAPDPLLVYGLPITEAFFDPVQNIQMQYFQRGRFEFYPNAPAGRRVQLSQLGVLTYQASKVQPINMATNTPNCRQYNRFYVCYAFLAFFDAHGGLAQFGYPISNYSKEGDQTVQYFERARFEYHPGLSRDLWVSLTDIGRIQFDQSHRPPILLAPSANQNNLPAPSPVTSLQIKAYVSKAMVTANSQQGLTVIVLDQDHQPVELALATVTIHWSDAMVETLILPPTDQHGVTHQEGILVGNLKASQFVPVGVEVTYAGLHAATSTWFFVWW